MKAQVTRRKFNSLMMVLALVGLFVGERLAERIDSEEPPRVFKNVMRTARSPDGSLIALAIAEEGSPRIEIYDTYTGDLKTSLPYTKSRVDSGSLHFSGNNKTLVVAYGAPIAYSVETGKLLKRFKQRGRYPQVKLSHDGNRIAIKWIHNKGRKGMLTLTVHCLKRRSDGVVFKKEVQQDELYANFSLDREGKHIIFGSKRKLVRRNLKTGKEKALPYRASNQSMNQGRWLALSGKSYVQILDIETTKELGRLQHAPRGMRYEGDTLQGARVLTSSDFDGYVQVWDFPSERIILETQGLGHLCQLSSDGRYLSTWPGVAKRAAKIYECNSGRVVHELLANESWKYVAFAGQAGSFSVWVIWRGGSSGHTVEFRPSGLS
jgi:WD40 repeat protein